LGDGSCDEKTEISQKEKVNGKFLPVKMIGGAYATGKNEYFK
jgi:hypothetical protein